MTDTARPPNGMAPLSPPPKHTDGGPMTPMSPTGTESKKKANPLVDLIESEKIYVDQLTGIIRKVASAWSRSNLPPPELDAMFRGVESIFKANRGLLAKLNEIGTNPSSPKALGDLLMKWIDDLEGPYTKFCGSYCIGFDHWDRMHSNARLPGVLATFSAANPPPLPPNSPLHPSEPPLWTLDQLFLLPKARLKYYRKLYGKLLKSTQPGRSDHRLLVGAVEKLERLQATLNERSEIDVSIVRHASLVPVEMEDEVVIDLRARDSTAPPPKRQDPEPRRSDPEPPSTEGSFRSSNDSGARTSVETTSTSLDRMSTSTLNMPVIDLERRLSIERCLDIFSMKPKQVRLQIASPTHKREILASTDVVISFVPRSTGNEVVHEFGHIFLLTDLFLVCEKIDPLERKPDGADMWLAYPPLAGKHLRVNRADGDDCSLQVTIMKKEILTLQTESRSVRDKLMSDFKECIEFATTAPAPPMPPLPGSIASPANSLAPSELPGSPMSGSSSTRPPSDGFMSPPRNDSRGPELMHPTALRPPVGDMRPSILDGPPPPIPDKSPSSLRGTPPMTSPPPGGMHPAGMGFNPNGSMGYPPERMGSGGSMGPPPDRMGSVGSMGPPPERMGSVGSMGPPPDRMGSVGSMRSPPERMGPMGQRPAGPPDRMGSLGQRPMPPGSGPPPPAKGFGPGQIMPGPGGPPSFGPGQMQPARSASAGPGPGPRPPPPDQYSRPPLPPGAAAGYFPGGPPVGAPFPPGRGPPGPNGMMGAPMGPGGPGGMHPGPPNGMGPNGMGPNGMGPPGARPMGPGYGPPGGPMMQDPNMLRKASSSSALASQYERAALNAPRPPMPGYPGPGGPPGPNAGLFRADSSDSGPLPRPLMPSANNARVVSSAGSPMPGDEISPPGSPVQTRQEPITTRIAIEMKCRVFLQQMHQQWKSLGSARLNLYIESPTNVKQLAVAADDKKKSVLISTIVLTDGVERVGKTGVAVELSDNGKRTGIVYMIQAKDDNQANKLYETLLAGSDRMHR